jgi:DNA-binding transcriptional MerR regulator
MSEPDIPREYSLTLLRMTGDRPPTYSLDAAAGLAGLHPEMLRHYCRLGLLGAARARPGTELIFDDDALYELRRFEHYRLYHGMSRRTLRLISHLEREVERLQAELRFLRGP